ncbi:MAG: hypothetical protein ACREMA_00995, partial [Longimicrobiales bacterium]
QIGTWHYSGCNKHPECEPSAPLLVAAARLDLSDFASVALFLKSNGVRVELSDSGTALRVRNCAGRAIAWLTLPVDQRYRILAVS